MAPFQTITPAARWETCREPGHERGAPLEGAGILSRGGDGSQQGGGAGGEERGWFSGFASEIKLPPSLTDAGRGREQAKTAYRLGPGGWKELRLTELGESSEWSRYLARAVGVATEQVLDMLHLRWLLNTHEEMLSSQTNKSGVSGREPGWRHTPGSCRWIDSI